jgi:hypothetical protein
MYQRPCNIPQFPNLPFIPMIYLLNKPCTLMTSLRMMNLQLCVSLSFAPIKDDNRQNGGVIIDMIRFRYLVAFSVKTTKIMLVELPKDFIYLFSRLFTCCLNVKSSKESYFFQFYHLFFFFF